MARSPSAARYRAIKSAVTRSEGASIISQSDRRSGVPALEDARDRHIPALFGRSAGEGSGSDVGHDGEHPPRSRMNDLDQPEDRRTLGLGGGRQAARAALRERC